MKKKLLTLILLCCMLTLVGCGKTESKNSKNTASGTKKSESKEELNIDDIEISFEPGSTSDYSYDGKTRDIMKMAYTNNTKFTIYSVEMILERKEDITFDQMKKFFPDSYAESMDDFEYDEFVALNYNRTEPKESNNDGIAYMNKPELAFPSQEALDSFEKKSLQVMYVGKDEMIHYAAYSYSNGTWSEYKDPAEKIEKADVELAELVPDIELDVVQIDYISSDSDCVEYHAYDTSEQYFKEYVSKIKEAGFTEDPSEYEQSYDADNSKGNNIDVDYEPCKNLLRVRIEKD